MAISGAFPWRRVLHNIYFQAAGVALVVFLVYLVTNKGANPYDHFVRLSDAFLHGHLYLVNAPSWLELVRIGEKGFVINPPAPTLFVLPAVLIWGLDTSQAIISMVVGAAAAGLFWIAAARFRWGLGFRIAMTALFALGTNLWWASTEGSVWTFAHVSAVFFLAAALVEATGRNRAWLLGILVGLAGLSRLPTFFAFPFFAYMLSRNTGERKTVIRRLAVFGGVLVGMGGLYLLYTYGEYGKFNLGYDQGQFLAEPWFSKGLFSLSYIPRQVNAMLFAGPAFSEALPFFRPSPAGLGLFFVTPALFFIFLANLRENLTAAALAAMALIMVPIVTYGATGFTQFGYRFSLDFMPFMIMLVASGMQYRLDSLKITLIGLSVYVNLWGVLLFDRQAA